MSALVKSGASKFAFDALATTGGAGPARKRFGAPVPASLHENERGRIANAPFANEFLPGRAVDVNERYRVIALEIAKRPRDHIAGATRASLLMRKCEQFQLTFQRREKFVFRHNGNVWRRQFDVWLFLRENRA